MAPVSHLRVHAVQLDVQLPLAAPHVLPLQLAVAEPV
jgi:hypothetical protein